ncbi:M14 family metallopeptidase [candidate division KSB1 bacterium]
MKFLPRKLFVLFICAVLFISFTKVSAQKVPINFNDFHGYTGSVKYMQDVARVYPNITELLEIGESNMGRTMYVLVISNMSNSTTIDAEVELRNMRKEGVKNVTPMKSYMGKPGHWIDGGIHGDEYTGTEVCLYIIDKLVTGYGSDSEVTALIDKNCYYFCPTVNPDGVYNSAEADIPQRQNSMKIDNDNDGKINEDGPDDINGDGHITQFRYKDDNGRYVIDDVDPRYMRQLGRDETTTKPRYSVIREDYDNDKDGRRGEDGEAGFDMNRNFPEGWFNPEGFAGGTGRYPGSTPETKAIMEFFTNHTNIIMAQNFHTSGGFTYRPLGTAPNNQMEPKDIAVYDRIMGKKYLELLGNPVPEAWQVDGPLDSFKAELRRTSNNQHAIERGYEMPDGWIHGWREDSDRPYSFGMVIDWMYKQFGAYSTTTELWNRNRDMKGIPQFTGENARDERERALLKYQDENFGGKFFIDWKNTRHPDLGEGEIGGWIPRYRNRDNNAFPGESLLGVCETHWQFEKFRSELLPEVVITNANARLVYSGNSAREAEAVISGDQVTIKRGDSKGNIKIVEVTATVENVGKLATHLEIGRNLAGNRDDAVWLIGDRDKIKFLQGRVFESIGVLAGTMPIPGFENENAGSGQRAGRGGRGGQRAGQQVPPAAPIRNPESRRELKWLISIDGDSPLKIVLTSQKGGTKVQELTIR